MLLDITIKKYPILLCCTLVIYCSTKLLLDFLFRGNQRMQQEFSSFLADNDLVIESGYQQQWQSGEEGISSAVDTFQDALRMDVASPYRWCDLAEALLESGQVEKARYCFAQAFRLGPHSPQVLFRAANFHFRVQEERKAVQNLSLILKSVPQYDAMVFSLYTRMGIDLEEILNFGLTADQRACQSYFRYLLQRGTLPDVQKTWNWISSQSLADDPLAGEYIDFLLNRRQYEMAAEAWARHAGGRRGTYLKTDCFFNGDFEYEPSGTSFDWKIRQLDGVNVTRDAGLLNSGNFSLRIRFDGKENLAYNHISQIAFVKPGTYLFQAHIRTAEITTDQGVGFRILDVESPARLEIRTETVRGTNDWIRLEKTFLVPQQTRLIEVQVVRQPSLKFDNKICGTAWIDRVTMTPIGSGHIR